MSHSAMSLSDDEAGKLMQAVAAVLEPWMADHDATIDFDGEPMAIRVRGVRPDAPSEIKALDAVWMGIIEKGALAISSAEVERHRDYGAPLCDCGTPGKGQHYSATCTRREDNHA